MSKTHALKNYLPVKFESGPQANDQRLATIKALRKRRPTDLSRTHSMWVARILGKCSKASPCKVEACPRCRRVYRKSFVKAFLKSELQHAIWTRVSIIPDGLLFPEGELKNANLKAIIKRLNKNIQRSNLADAIIIGGIDISLNVFENDVQGWQLHLYFLINRPLTNTLKTSINDAFNKGADKSFSFKEIKSDKQTPLQKHIGRALTYVYKNGFNRRSSYYEARLKRDGSPRINVRSLPLKAHQLAELSSWLGKYSVGDRLFLRNIKRLRAAPLSMKFSLQSALIKQSLSPQKRE